MQCRLQPVRRANSKTYSILTCHHREKVEAITELVNIFDKDKFQQEVENTTGRAAKADKIASSTAKHISERMDEDPAFYKKFSPDAERKLLRTMKPSVSAKRST
jgi:hypothetical protein